ncbi:hypothetical protein AVEN_230143-1 [Araneus ventricosus]|uniref:Uncharacterized protein n=1 Tax=Araneus ventricosus TaxID=182803 RepID=A0A4Y2AZR8_ARAVE|nr:hypothetical protein AVEN_230143-1 [Araneus ventricosus]
MSAIPLTKMFVARDWSDKMTEIVGCIRWKTTSPSKSHPIGLNFHCLRFSIAIVCIFKAVEYRPQFPSSCLNNHMLQTFLVSGIALVLTITEHDSCPCDICFRAHLRVLVVPL